MSDFVLKAIMAGGVLAMLYRIYLQFTISRQTAIQVKDDKKVSSDLESIAKEVPHVQETEKDFDAAVDEFNRNNPGK